MFGLDLLPIEMIGVLAAAVAGVITLIPALGETDARRASVAIGALVLGVFAQDNFTFVGWQEFISQFFSAAVYALATYKLVLQPLVLPTVDKALSAMGVKAKYRG